MFSKGWSGGPNLLSSNDCTPQTGQNGFTRTRKGKFGYSKPVTVAWVMSFGMHPTILEFLYSFEDNMKLARILKIQEVEIFLLFLAFCTL